MSEQEPIRPMSYEDANARMVRMAKMLRGLEEEHADAVKAEASSEQVYRQTLAGRIDHYRTEGLAVDHAVAKARADCAVLSRERDEAAGKVRNVLERLQDRRGERDGLHRLVAWSHSVAIRENGGDPNPYGQ